MKKIKEVYFLNQVEKNNLQEVGYYSDGFLFITEDGDKIYTQSTDSVAYKKMSKTE